LVEDLHPNFFSMKTFSIIIFCQDMVWFRNTEVLAKLMSSNIDFFIQEASLMQIECNLEIENIETIGYQESNSFPEL